MSALGTYWGIVRKKDRKLVHVFQHDDVPEYCRTCVKTTWGPRYMLKRIRVSEVKP